MPPLIYPVILKVDCSPYDVTQMRFRYKFVREKVSYSVFFFWIQFLEPRHLMQVAVKTNILSHRMGLGNHFSILFQRPYVNRASLVLKTVKLLLIKRSVELKSSSLSFAIVCVHFWTKSRFSTVNSFVFWLCWNFFLNKKTEKLANFDTFCT